MSGAGCISCRLRRTSVFCDTESKRLVELRGDIHSDILDPAVQDAAEIVDRGGGHGLIFSQTVDSCTGKMVDGYKRVGGFGRIREGFPKWTIVNHQVSLLSSVFSLAVSRAVSETLLLETVRSASVGGRNFQTHSSTRINFDFILDYSH